MTYHMRGGCPGSPWSQRPASEADQTARFKPQHHEVRHRRAFARSSETPGALLEPGCPRWGSVRVPASSSGYHRKEDDTT